MHGQSYIITYTDDTCFLIENYVIIELNDYKMFQIEINENNLL
jgi:hypothetical protein